MGKGRYTRPEAELPLNEVFAHLRQVWLDQDPERTSGQLAEEWSRETDRTVRPQNVSNYATGSGGRQPPMWMVLDLAERAGLEVVLRPDEVTVRAHGGVRVGQQ